MDLPAHLFWSWAIFKIINKKIKKPLNLKLAVFWGVFPDLFAFGIPIFLLLIELITGKISLSDLPGAEKIEPPHNNFSPILSTVSTLYSASHSFVIFFAVVLVWTAVLYLKRKTPSLSLAQIIPWEMSGWMLHILIDIPTHSTQFYSTPFFWPISSIRFSGISWGTPWFLALNYLAILIVYFAYFRKRKFSV